LRDAVKLLSEADKTKNPVGRNFVMGKALVTWMMQGDAPTVTKRSVIGYPTNPEGSVDLILAIDSAFTAVEAAMPECAEKTQPWRQQKGWAELVNGAIEQSNANNMDSAVVLANRSLTLYKGGPYA